MTALLPTRVSVYDFLFEDTLPIDALFADIGNISIPQARLLIQNGTQAITSALMAYNQKQGPEAILKKLLTRSLVKDLRKYNAFNFKTMYTAYQNGHSINEALFRSTEVQKQVCQKLAQQANLNPSQVRDLLGALSLLCLREIAILADYAQLNEQEINDWFALQPQFFQLKRDIPDAQALQSNGVTMTSLAPSFDPFWHQITGYQLPTIATAYNSQQMPHYARVIGRTSNNTSASNNSNNNSIAANGPLIVDNSNNSDVLTFDSIVNITLPYQRWLLQLAKISDIYLSRRRLKVAPEPIQPPSRPFVNFGFLNIENGRDSDTQAEDRQSVKDPTPLWKNPVLILLVIVIGGLTLLAVGKYQYKKSQTIQPTVHQGKIQV